jgi:hypothetical protein
MPKGSYESQMHAMIDYYVAELFKFLKIRNIFKVIEKSLYFPVDSELPIFINHRISKRIEEEDDKKKAPKQKSPRRPKNRYNHLSLAEKSHSHHSGSVQTQTQPEPSADPRGHKNGFMMPFVYQSEIEYYPKLKA